MSYYYDIKLEFEQDFQSYLINRMYPSGHGKETTMTKPTNKHVGAIIRSILLLKSGLNDELEKRFHKSIERDLKYMEEVREMLLNMIENPTLPFTNFNTEHPHPLIGGIDQEPNAAF